MKTLDLPIQKRITGKRFVTYTVQCPIITDYRNAEKCITCKYLRIMLDKVVKCSYGNPIHTLKHIQTI